MHFRLSENLTLLCGTQFKKHSYKALILFSETPPKLNLIKIHSVVVD
jgi:hypothetical protein